MISVDHGGKQFVFLRPWPKMTSSVDSEAHLAKRATEVGLTDGALQSLVRSGLSTLGRLAFAHGLAPNAIMVGTFAYAKDAMRLIQKQIEATRSQTLRSRSSTEPLYGFAWQRNL